MDDGLWVFIMAYSLVEHGNVSILLVMDDGLWAVSETWVKYQQCTSQSFL